jgi:hypothetical protein
MEGESKKGYTPTLIAQLQNQSHSPNANLRSTALVEPCYFGGKITGIVYSIIETLGHERGRGDMYCWPSGFTPVERFCNPATRLEEAG